MSRIIIAATSALLLSIAHVTAQTKEEQPGVTRQKSAGILRKVVYSGNTADCDQVISGTRYDAQVRIPEITLDNMPDVTVYVYRDGGTPLGGWASDMSPSYRVTENLVSMPWKYKNISGDDFIMFTQFKIVVVYDEILEVANPGKGTSLDLKIKYDEENGRPIRGYRVFRKKKE